MSASLKRRSAARGAVIAALGGEMAVCGAALHYPVSGSLQEIKCQEAFHDTALANKRGGKKSQFGLRPQRVSTFLHEGVATERWTEAGTYF